MYFDSQRVHFDIQVGEHAIDYANVAQKEKLTELQLRVRQLLDQVEGITKEQNYQRVGSFLLLDNSYVYLIARDSCYVGGFVQRHHAYRLWGGWVYLYSFICLSAGAVEWVYLLCYHSIALCAFKGDINASTICHL